MTDSATSRATGVRLPLTTATFTRSPAASWGRRRPGWRSLSTPLPPMAGAYLADRPSARSAGAVPARRAGRGGAGMTGPRFVPATGQQR